MFVDSLLILFLQQILQNTLSYIVAIFLAFIVEWTKVPVTHYYSSLDTQVKPYLSSSSVACSKGFDFTFNSVTPTLEWANPNRHVCLSFTHITGTNRWYGLLFNSDNSRHPNELFSSLKCQERTLGCINFQIGAEPIGLVNWFCQITFSWFCP